MWLNPQDTADLITFTEEIPWKTSSFVQGQKPSNQVLLFSVNIEFSLLLCMFDDLKMSRKVIKRKRTDSTPLQKLRSKG